MKKDLARNQGGSVVSYVIIAALALLVLGFGVYSVVQIGQQARKDNAKIAIESNQNNSSVVGDESSNATNDNDNNNDESSNKNTSSLPTTGLTIGFVDLLAVFMLATTLSSYLASRRALAKSYL